AIPNDIFMITPTGTNKNITDLDDDPDMDGRGLVWRPIASDVYQANAIADRMNAIASQNSTAILYKDDAYGTDLVADIVLGLDPGVEAVTITRSYSVPADQMQLQMEIGALLGDVIANEMPETVVIL